MGQGVKPRTQEEMAQDAEKHAYEMREAMRQQKLDQQAAAEAQHQELLRQAAQAYDNDKRTNLPMAWGRKLAGAYEVRTADEQAQRDAEKAARGQWLREHLPEAKNTDVFPESWKPYVSRQPEHVRQPVEYQRDVAGNEPVSDAAKSLIQKLQAQELERQRQEALRKSLTSGN